MARRPQLPVAKQPAQLSPEEMKAGIARLKKRVEALNAFNVDEIREQFDSPTVKGLQADIDEALVRTFGGETLDYDRYRSASHFHWGPVNTMYDTPLQEIHAALDKSKRDNIAVLEQAISSLEERLAEVADQQPIRSAPIAPQAKSRRVFVVHGHDEGARESVARFLEQIEFEPVILHEQANRGRTVIEKVEAHADVGFAVVLLTADDLGGKNAAELQPRTRQNVLLELGYFLGRLGRDRVCALKRGDIELPSDFGGVVWTVYDDGGGWRTELGKELQAAGFDVDWNKVMRH